MKTKRAFIFWATLFYLLLSAMPSWAYYNPSAGRWLNRDPIEEDGGNNLVVFVGNNPVNAIDPLGKFLTFGHNKMIENAFGLQSDMEHYLSTGDRDLLKAGSRYVDSAQFQKPEFSYMHAMAPKAKPNENQEDLNARARQQATQFVTDQFWDAVGAGSRNDALFALGMGMHTIMDSFSPEHVFEDGSPKPWRGLNSLAGLGGAAAHGLKEFFHSIPSYINNVTGSTDVLQGYYDDFKLLSE